MDPVSQFRSLLAGPEPVLALAPMQDITDLAFWRLMARYGGPDLYFTEYFRVYPGSRLDRHVLCSITENLTGRPAVAQMIGNDPAELIRTARELQQHPVAAIDLNLGCPAPVVYRKCAGGGLLREPDRIDAILDALREAVSIPLTVKTRVGFAGPEGFEQLLAIFARHQLDLVTVHGRTVREMYRAPVHYDLIARAVEALPCPVLANGNVHSGKHGWEVLQETGARGLMIGRGAIRNPWVFRQFRSLAPGSANASERGCVVPTSRSKPPEAERIRHHSGVGCGSHGGETDAPCPANATSGPVLPIGREVLAYIEALFEATAAPGLTEASHVQRIKKHMNFLALGVDPTGEFLHRVRRVRTQADFFALCREHLDHDRPMPLEPFELELPQTDVLCGQHR